VRYQLITVTRLIVRVRRWCDAEKTKLSSDGGNSDSNKRKRDHGGAYSGIWLSVRLDSGVLSQAVTFVLVRLAGMWLHAL
jgi:hypothetical protein